MPRQPRITNQSTLATPTDGAQTLDITSIADSNITQSRASLNRQVVSDYVELMDQGVVFPPILIARIQEEGEFAVTLLVLDGFHRLAAAKQYGAIQIAAIVTTMSVASAITFCVQANSTHGLRRTNEDKRHAVRLLLARPEWANKSNREIALACCVTHPFVQAVKDITEGWMPVVEIVETETPPETSAVVSTTSSGFTDTMREADLAIGTVEHSVSQLAIRIRDLCTTQHGSFINIFAVMADMDNAVQGLRQSRPEAICPVCSPTNSLESCRLCRGKGWISRLMARHGLPSGLTNASL